VESILQWPLIREASPLVSSLVQIPTVELLSLPNGAGRSHVSGSLRLDVEPKVLDRLMQDFLEFNHIKNPVLDTKLLREDVRVVAENGLQWDGGSCLVVSIRVLATGAHAESYSLISGALCSYLSVPSAVFPIQSLPRIRTRLVSLTRLRHIFRRHKGDSEHCSKRQAS
jgi:hypothetical protein